MDKMKGTATIHRLRKKWVLAIALSDLLLATGTAFLLGIVLQWLFGWACGWSVLYGLLLLLVLFFLHRRWKVTSHEIAELLDQTYPGLQESSGLLLREMDSLNLLEKLQCKRTNDVLLQLDKPLPVTKKIGLPAFAAAVLVIGGLLLQYCNFSAPRHMPSIPSSTAAMPLKKEVLPAQLTSLQVLIAPPAYTARAARQQESFTILAEEGAVAEWRLQTNQPAVNVDFVFNDKQTARLKPVNEAHTQWTFRKKIDTTGFYQLRIDEHASELYKIEIIPDKPPVIRVQSPKQYTTIDYGETPEVKVTGNVGDDYGIASAFITATIASGSGEAVKFREQKIALPAFVAGKTQYQLQQLLSLTNMGMQPGDELYFYVQATDNHQQQTRSDIFIVHLPDTAQLMSLEGLANTLTLKPEYFRSQRQIIIETEQLLKDKDTISTESFKSRSNNLGIDQKLLRLRYGKFLGDEAESGESGADAVNDLADFSNADKLRDAFTDKHDNAEDASFYEPETKKQLRAILTEMWGAELHLRTFTPRDALPFAYRALRLLKDLQQKSRAYVAKTNYKTTPLDPNKRLTGDLGKIQQNRLQKNIEQQEDALEPVRLALAALEQLKTNGNANTPNEQVLQQASLRLQEKAIQQPGRLLNSVTAMKQVLAAIQTGHPVLAGDAAKAQQGLQLLLDAPPRMPAAQEGGIKKALREQYFKNLQKQQP